MSTPGHKAGHNKGQADQSSATGSSQSQLSRHGADPGQEQGHARAALKTIAAFLGSPYGGTLLIGVEDDADTGHGCVIGLGPDYATQHKDGKDDADLLQLQLTQLVANAVGVAATANVTTQIHRINGDAIHRIHVERAASP